MPIFAGQIVTADYLHNLDVSGTYTPTLTAVTSNPNLGADGAAEGWWQRTGHRIRGRGFFRFAGSGVDEGSGSYAVSLPFDADTSLMRATTAAGGGEVLGGAVLRDNSLLTASRIAVATLVTASTAQIRYEDSDGSQNAAHNLPWTWVAGDTIMYAFDYIADPSGLP